MKLLSYILSPIFALTFFLILLIFHPLQWLGLQIHQKYQQKVVEGLNWCLIKSLLILGVSVRFKNKHDLSKGDSYIFVANHQSLFDIPPMIWYLRKHLPKFVAKKELGKGIPSISFNLTHGGACLIDRKNRIQSITELENYSKRLHDNKWSAFIFPEGTRSRTGQPKDFSFGGLKTIIKYNTDAKIVPISVNNSWKVFKYGKFPFGLFTPITIDVHEPISLENKDVEEVLKLAEEKVKSKIIID